jgi:hypothetical protein
MLVDIEFYDKPQNDRVKVDTWNGGLTLTMKAEDAGTEEDIVIDAAVPYGMAGVYWAGGLNHYIEDYSDYQVLNDYQRKFDSLREHMDYLNDWGSPYGVADNLDQIMTQLSRYWFEPDRLFVLELSTVKKADQPEQGGWRWHKWGEYIGDHDPQWEYLADEPDIDEVMLFEFIEVVPLQKAGVGRYL